MMNRRRIKDLINRLRTWESLVDTSIYFALAGLKHKGYSEEQSWEKLRKRWKRDSQEHKQVNLKIIRRLYAQGNKNK